MAGIIKSLYPGITGSRWTLNCWIRKDDLNRLAGDNVVNNSYVFGYNNDGPGQSTNPEGFGTMGVPGSGVTIHENEWGWYYNGGWVQGNFPSDQVGDDLDGWYNIHATENASGLQIYVNGVAQTMSVSGSQTGSANLGDANYGIGYRRASSNQYFDGKIDQLRIYKAALEQVQVDELYAETASDNDDLSLGGPAEIIVSANANAGFSIVQYEGNSEDSQKIPHGLSAAPELIITKAMNFTAGWPTQASGYYGLRLNSNAANDTANGNVFYKNTAPTATVFTVGGSDEVNDDYSYISYCFHSVSGYSKIGTYTGNGSTTGPTVTTGFQPDFLLVKDVTNSSTNWRIVDSVRGTNATDGSGLFPNLDIAEQTDGTQHAVEFQSNGFQIRNATSGWNNNSATHIYMAFKIN